MDFRKIIDDIINYDDGYGKDDPDEMFHPSSAGFCRRQILLNKLGLTKHSMKTKGSFLTGKIIHNFIQEKLSNCEIEKPIRLDIPDSSLYFKGKIDVFDGIVYDLKTTSDIYYNIEGPKHEHIAQVNVYMKAVGVDKAQIIYIDKRNFRAVFHDIILNENLLTDIYSKIKDVYEIYMMNKEGADVLFPACPCYQCISEIEDVRDRDNTPLRSEGNTKEPQRKESVP